MTDPTTPDWPQRTRGREATESPRALGLFEAERGRPRLPEDRLRCRRRGHRLGGLASLAAPRPERRRPGSRIPDRGGRFVWPSIDSGQRDTSVRSMSVRGFGAGVARAKPGGDRRTDRVVDDRVLGMLEALDPVERAAPRRRPSASGHLIDAMLSRLSLTKHHIGPVAI
jgi:hypothetical protein